MNFSILSYRYSFVLADIFITKTSKLDFYLNSFNVLLGVDKIANFFFSPFISKSKKMDLINEMSVLISNKHEKEDVKLGKDIFIRFLNILLDYRRMELFSEIFQGYKKQISNINNEINCNAIFATEIDKVLIKKLELILSKLFNHNMNINLSIDDSLIAGMKLWIGNYLIDTSLKSRLGKLEKSLLEE